MDTEMKDQVNATEETENEEPEVRTDDEGMEDGGIGIGEDGSLVFSDDFFDGLGDAPKEAPAEPAAPAETKTEPTAAEPAFYTPQEMAEAFATGAVDAARLRPEVKDYYEAIMSKMPPETPTQPQQFQPVQQLPVQQQPQQPAALPQVDYAVLAEAAKKVACKSLLKISEDDFDEFDPNHARAQNMAMMDIRDRAMEMSRQQAAQENARAQMTMAAQARMADLNLMYAEAKQQNSDFDAANAYYSKWREGLTVKESREVDQIIQRGNKAQVSQLLGRLLADYREAHGVATPGQQTTNQAKKPAPTPPKVEGVAGSQSNDNPGVVDVSVLANMSQDEQVNFLLKNKFA